MADPTVERFRRALMDAHHNDWSMTTISEAAHICASAADPTVSDGATLDEMTEQAAKALLYSNCSTADPNAFKGWIKDARAALNAAGIPDLLAALRVKEEVNEANRALNRELLKLIEEKAQQLDVLTTERDMSIRMEEALSVECAGYREALEKIIIARHQGVLDKLELDSINYSRPDPRGDRPFA